MIRFQSPADVKGVALLSIQDNQQDLQWLYLPATKRIRRVSSSERADNFMGSDFSYEDIEQTNLDEFKYSLLGEETLDGIACYVIQSIPADMRVREESGYGRSKLWIRKDNLLSKQVHFFDKEDSLIKILTSEDQRRLGNDGRWRAHQITMQNVQTGHRTELHYETIHINGEIPDLLFTKRYLERGN